MRKKDQSIETFKKIIWQYYRKNGRDLPWRPPSLKLWRTSPPSLKLRRDAKTVDPYKILVSEIMLQQTQVNRVTPKYQSFTREFGSFEILARAKVRDILREWHGLGYSRRALYLKRAAEIVVNDFGGKLPQKQENLERLPGVGKNTAGAILAFAFNKPVAFIETNVRSVFLHHFFKNRNAVDDKKILKLIEKSLPTKRQTRGWYYALMDYGSYLKHTVQNPNKKSKHYVKQPPFKGSRRELRGKILKEALEKGKVNVDIFAKTQKVSKRKTLEATEYLEAEGFLLREHGDVRLR